MNIRSPIPIILASSDSILLDNPEHFSQSNFLLDFLRSIGWIIVQMLRFLANGTEGILEAVYEFLDITQSPAFTAFYDEFGPLIPISLTLSIIILGLTYMFTDQKPKVFKNLFMGLLVLFGATTATNYLNQAIMLSFDYFTADSSMTDATIKAHITDLLYMDSIDWDYSTGEFNQLSGIAITFLDPTEKVSKKSEVSSLGKDIFNTHFAVDSAGSVISETIGTKGWFDIFDPPYYYRFKIGFFRIYIMLIITMAVYVVAGYKAFKIIHELIVGRIAGALVAGDLTSGQKTKKVIENFVSAYLCLFFILVCFRLYNIYQQYINAQGWNAIVKMFLLIFAGLVVLDGPNVIEKLFGMDIGLSNELFKIMSVSRVGAGAVGLAGRVASGTSALGSAIKNAKNPFADGGIKSDNPNKDKQGETKEPTVDPTTKPETGPYGNAVEPNGQVHSPNGEGGSANYQMSSAMHSGGSGSFDSTGSSNNNKTDDEPNSGSFAQNTAEPNEDFNSSTGNVTVHEDFSDSDSNLQHDMSEGSNVNDDLNNGNDGHSANSNPDGMSRSEGAAGTGSFEQANNYVGADEMKMSKQAGSGINNGSTGASDSNHISQPSQQNTTSRSSGSDQGTSHLSESGHIGQPNMTHSGNVNSGAIQEPGKSSGGGQGQPSSSVSTEMGALRSESGITGTSSSEPGTSSQQPGQSGATSSGSTNNNTADNSRLKAGQSQDMQPNNNVSSPKVSSDPEQEKASFLDQRWGVDDVKPSISSRGSGSISSSGTGGSGSGRSGESALKQSGNATTMNPDMASTTQAQGSAGSGFQSAASSSGSNDTAGSSSNKNTAAFTPSTNNDTAQPNVSTPETGKAELGNSDTKGSNTSNDNNKTGETSGKGKDIVTKAIQTGVDIPDRPAVASAKIGAAANTLNTLTRSDIQPKEPGTKQENHPQSQGAQQPNQKSGTPATGETQTKPRRGRGRPKKNP